tara:strand:+ start:205 stop:411 length:207 start_codon:yes stop_codon:yes gene_type:complete
VKYTEEELEMFEWLEMLRQSGVVNMFGASPYLADAFDLDEREARDVLLKWMDNYEDLVENGYIERGDA